MSILSWLLDSPLVYRLGSGLVHFLWQGAIVAVALSFAMWLLRRQSASTRYIASWIALVALAACVPVTAWVSDVPPRAIDSTADGRAVVSSGRDSDYPAWQENGRPALRREQNAPDFGDHEHDVAVQNVTEGDGTATIAMTPAARQTDLADSPSESHRTWWLGALPWIVGGWLVGAIGLSLWRAGGWLHLRRACRVGTRAVSQETSHVFECLLERLRVSRPVRLLESTLARSPIVIGWLRPVVLLPVAIVAELPAQQLEMILAHELAHIRRWDFFWNLIQTVIETLLFYHPAVWWVSRQIRAEREACCDEMAATVMGDRLLYAQSLASLEEMRHERNQQLGSSLQVAADNGMLLGRIRRVLGLPDEDRRAGYGWLGGILAVSLVAATLAGYMATADEPTERSEATIGDEADTHAASNGQSPSSPPPSIAYGEAKDSNRMGTPPSEQALGPNDDQTTADTQPVEKFAGVVTDERGRPLEGVTVKMCGVEKFHDGRWHRNGRPDCLVPRPTKSDETGRFVVEFAEAAFDMPFDEKKTRVNLWFDKEGYAPTYLPGVFPKPQDTTVVLRRGIQVSGTVKRQTNGQSTPVEGAVVCLQCSSGDFAHQKRVFDDPYFFLLKREEGEEGCDLPYRQRVLTDADGRYTVTLSPPPKDKRWFLVCSDESWNKDSAWRGPKLVKGVILDVKEGQPTTGPDFVVGAQVNETVNGLQCRLRTTKRIWKVGEPLKFEADIWGSHPNEWTRPTDPLKRYRVEVDGQWYSWVGQVGIRPGERFPQAPIGKQPDTLSIKVDWAWWDDAGQWLKCLPGKYTVRVGIPVQPADDANAESIRVVSNPVQIEIVTEDDPAPKAPWGAATEGVQTRLRADRRTWKKGESPTLLADVRNRGTRELHLWRHQALCELEFDGRWYEWARAEGSFKSSWFPPGREYFGISFNLLDNWQSKTDKKPLALTAGQHKVRVAIIARSPNAKDRNKLPPIRSVSNEVTIEILPTTTERNQVDGSASGRDRDDPLNSEPSSLDAQLNERLNRLCTATEQAFEDVGLSEEDVKAGFAILR